MCKSENLKLVENRKFEVLKVDFWFFVIQNSNQGLECYFSNRGEKLVCVISRKSKIDVKTVFSIWGRTEPHFRANLLFGCAQSGYERTSFSGSTVPHILFKLNCRMLQ